VSLDEAGKNPAQTSSVIDTEPRPAEGIDEEMMRQGGPPSPHATETDEILFVVDSQ